MEEVEDEENNDDDFESFGTEEWLEDIQTEKEETEEDIGMDVEMEEIRDTDVAKDPKDKEERDIKTEDSSKKG